MGYILTTTYYLLSYFESSKPAMRSRTWQWLATGLLFAGGSEGLQYLLPYRAYNVNDLVANGLGVVLGSLMYWVLSVKRILSSR